MENYNKEELQNAFIEWCAQWTIEFIQEKLLPNYEKVIKNPITQYCLIKWQKAHASREYNVKESIRNIIDGKEYGTTFYNYDTSKWNDLLYDIFTRVYGE